MSCNFFHNKYTCLIGLVAVMIYMTILSHRQIKKLASKTISPEMHRSTELQTKDATFDSQNVAYLDTNLDKLHTVFEQIDNVFRDEKKSIISFLSGPVINNHTFEYVHNPESTCTDSPTDILIVVPSAPGNFEKRKNIRQGDYGKFINTTENQAKLLFFVGKPNDNKSQIFIDQESYTYQDIVQESFEDIYHNIRYKAVSMLKWASQFCSGVKYVLRNDDDIAVNLTSVITILRRTGLNYSNFILGRQVLNEKPKRNEKHKVFLSYREYPETYFPPFALGGLLGYPILTVELLYEAALRVKPIWLDDVYITGLCGQKVGVKLLSDPQFEFKHRAWLKLK